MPTCSADALLPVVAVPARNEAKRLPALLAGLERQDWLTEQGRRLDVVVVLNNCTDGSSDAVLSASVRHERLSIHCLNVVLEPTDAHVGTARRLAMETAFDRLDFHERGVILTTDADAVPNPGWVSANLRHVGEGIDLVGGLVVGNVEEEMRLGPDFAHRALLYKRYGKAVDRLSSLLDPQQHDPWPRHHDHTGASIAVRADVYRAVGGLPARPFREDVAFVELVRAAGFLIRHPLDVEVEVSARLAGRAPGGMSDCLKAWMRAAARGEPVLVEDPERMVERWRAGSERVDPRDASGQLSQAAKPPTAASLVSAMGDLDAPKTMPVDVAIGIVAAMIERAEVGIRAA